jgi:amino acid permease
MLAFVLLLVIIWIVLGIIGAVIHGLIWLTIIAAVLFLATMLFGGNRLGRRRVRR